MTRGGRFVLAIGVPCLLALAAPPAEAQGFGVKVGATFSRVAVDPTDALGENVHALPGAIAGAYVTFREDARLSVQVDALVSLRRIAFGDDIEDQITYFEAPVVARYSILRRDSLVVRALAGASLNIVLRAEESVLGDDPFDIKAAMNSYEGAIVVGGQAEWNGRWTFEGRYFFGLSETYAEPIEGISARQRGFQITAGYRFR